jgi:MraZ protein
VFFAGAQDASPDKQGRVAIPGPLREFAGLNRDVRVTGAFDHVEIWDADTWARTKRSGEQGLAGDPAE